MVLKQLSLYFLVFLFTVLFLPLRGEAGESSENKWDTWFKDQVGLDSKETPLIQNRTFKKAGRFQWVGPLGGMLYRQDFYDHTQWSVMGRYFFKESWGWEVIRVSRMINIPSAAKKSVTASTGFEPDIQLGTWNVGTGLIWAPIYGKYAFGDSFLIHFDSYALLAPGIRYTTGKDQQAYLELGVGTHQHFQGLGGIFGIVLESRFRTYSENRKSGSPATIVDATFQIGPAFQF